MSELSRMTADPLANLSVEELEQRLEMQITGIPEADWCFINNSFNSNSVSLGR